jgi:hypothetical protein
VYSAKIYRIPVMVIRRAVLVVLSTSTIAASFISTVAVASAVITRLTSSLDLSFIESVVNLN